MSRGKFLHSDRSIRHNDFGGTAQFTHEIAVGAQLLYMDGLLSQLPGLEITLILAV